MYNGFQVAMDQLVMLDHSDQKTYMLEELTLLKKIAINQERFAQHINALIFHGTWLKPNLKLMNH